MKKKENIDFDDEFAEVTNDVCQLDVNSLYTFEIRYLYREWKLLSKCFGAVVVINGPSSSGKSTLSRYIGQYGFNILSLDDIWYECCYNNIIQSSLDQVSISFKEKFSLAKKFLNHRDFLKLIDGITIKAVCYDEYENCLLKEIQELLPTVLQNIVMPSPIEIFDLVYDKAREFIFSGRNVLLDLVVNEDIYFDMLSYSFRGYSITIGLLYTSFEEGLRRCAQRNYKFLKDITTDYRFPSQVITQYRGFYEIIVDLLVAQREKIIEKLDKVLISKALKFAVEHEKLLLGILESKNIKETVMSYESGQIDNQINAIIKEMDLLSGIEVSILSKVKYDFIIKTSSNFFSFNRANDYSAWYTDTHVSALLMDELNGDEYFIVAPTVFDVPFLLADNVRNAIAAIITGRISVMPIHLHGNHWAGAVIRPVINDNNQVIGINVFFYDPLGNPINLENHFITFLQVINDAVHEMLGDIIPNIVDLRLRHQHNGNDCGALTVQNLIQLAQANSEEMNIENITLEEVYSIIDFSVYESMDVAREIRDNHNSIFQRLDIVTPTEFEANETTIHDTKRVHQTMDFLTGRSSIVFSEESIDDDIKIVAELKELGNILNFFTIES